MKILLAFVTFIVVCNAWKSYPSYKLLGSIKVDDAAFLCLDRFSNNENSTYHLVISTFSAIPFYSDPLYYIPHIEAHLKDFSNTKPILLTKSITWPNLAKSVPVNVFANGIFSNSIVIAGGFLLPGKSTGAINIIADMTSSPKNPVQISEDKYEWFYHQVHWYDVNKDGRQDIVTARATKPILGSGKGELIWYEQPSDPTQGKWPLHHIVDGPDIFTALYDIDNDGTPELFATEFFGSQFTLYWTTSTWADPNSVQSKVIDSTIGPPFGLSIVDLNNDGKNEILVTNHVDNATLSGVYAYEIPQNWKTSTWPRHVLATGFPVTEPGFNQAAPGGAVAVWPRVSEKNATKPLILLSGDGSQEAYLLTPQSQLSSDWTYKTDVIINTGGTVGGIAAEDINGDGYVEFFIPDYDSGTIWAYTFSPR